MKKRVPTLDNLVYSQIILKINAREVYASELANELKKSQATLQKQLAILTQEGYVITKPHPEKKKNIKLFSLNWNKLKKNLFDYVRNLNPETQIKPSYYKNRYLELFLKELFITFKEDKITLKEIFRVLQENRFYGYPEVGEVSQEWREFCAICNLITQTNSKYAKKLFEAFHSNIHDTLVKELSNETGRPEEMYSTLLSRLIKKKASNIPKTQQK